MKILVYEHFTALGDAAPPPLRREGGAMLRALAADLSRAGHDVAVDAPSRGRAHRRRVPGSASDSADPGGNGGRGPANGTAGSVGSFRAAAKNVDAVWIIAPETGGRLERLTRAALDEGVAVLGSSPRAIRTAGSKWRTARALERAGVPVVPTLRVPAHAARLNGGTGWRFPLVLKPDDGVGCEGVELIRGEEELGRVRRTAALRSHRLIQPRLPGVAASVAVLVGPGVALPLAVASQRLRIGATFRYSGGEVPMDSPLAGRARALAVQACRAIPGLAGYVGVDLILTPEGPVVVEVNPRLTTSYLGLRAATRTNLAAAAIRALAGRRPRPVRFDARVRFDVGGRVMPAGPARSSSGATSARRRALGGSVPPAPRDPVGVRSAPRTSPGR